MSYTKEEVGIIKNNLKQIEEYAKNTFFPRLREHESVCVEFGENDPRRWNFSMEKDHSFGVSADGDVWYRTGGLVLYFEPPEWRADRSIYDSWTYAKDLLLHWPQVKRQVEDALTAKERERKAMLSFSVTDDTQENSVGIQSNAESRYMDSRRAPSLLEEMIEAANDLPTDAAFIEAMKAGVAALRNQANAPDFDRQKRRDTKHRREER